MVSERQSKEALQALLACGRCGFSRTKGIGDDGMRTEIFCLKKVTKDTVNFIMMCCFACQLLLIEL